MIVHGKNGQQTEVFAMLDSGCDCTLISAAKAQELGLVSNQESSQKVTITGVNGTNTVESITINQPIILSSPKIPTKSLPCMMCKRFQPCRVHRTRSTGLMLSQTSIIFAMLICQTSMGKKGKSSHIN